eukprot:3758383-Amphidinium_carterae.1
MTYLWPKAYQLQETTYLKVRTIKSPKRVVTTYLGKFDPSNSTKSPAWTKTGSAIHAGLPAEKSNTPTAANDNKERHQTT